MRRRQWRCRKFCQRCRTGRSLPVSPPPAMEKPSLSAIALATISVPLRKLGNSNTPTGPFHRMVLAFFRISASFCAETSPRSRICSSSLMSLTDFRVAVAVSRTRSLRERRSEPGYRRCPAGAWLHQPDLLRTGIYRRCGPERQRRC